MVSTPPSGAVPNSNPDGWGSLGWGLKLQVLFGFLMDMFLAGQLMVSGYWSLRSNSFLVSFDQHSVFVLIWSPGQWAKHGSPCVPPETLEKDRYMVNALNVRSVGSKCKYPERHLISGLSPAHHLSPVRPWQAGSPHSASGFLCVKPLSFQCWWEYHGIVLCYFCVTVRNTH